MARRAWIIAALLLSPASVSAGQVRLVACDKASTRSCISKSIVAGADDEPELQGPLAQADQADGLDLQVDAWRTAGDMARQQGDFATAARQYDSAVALLRRSETDPTRLAITLSASAGAHTELGDYATAEVRLRDAIAVLNVAPSAEVFVQASIWAQLGGVLVHRLKSREAIDTLTRAAALVLATEPPDPETLASIYNNRALAYEKIGMVSEALNDLEFVIRIHREYKPPDSLALGVAYNNFALTLNGAGAFAEAEPFYRRAIGIFDKHGGWVRVRKSRAMMGLAINLQGQGRMAEAEDQFRATLAFRRTMQDTSFEYIEGHWYLADQLAKMSRYGEARTLYRIALRASRARIATFRDYGGAAQVDLRRFEPANREYVAVAWALAMRR